MKIGHRRGLVRFSANRRCDCGKSPAENTDLSPLHREPFLEELA